MGYKLLIADDEELVRSGLARYLKNHCPFFDSVIEAKDGKETLELILQNNPDMIILDIQMPIYTGIDVMRQLENTSLRPIVIILSGFNDFKYAQQAMHYGAKDYMMKPVKAQDLVVRIKNLLGIKDETVEKTERDSIVTSAQEYIKDHYQEELSLTIVAEKLGLSSSYLSSKFSSELNLNFVDYVNKIRIDHACDFLKTNQYKIYEVSEKVGFRDTKYFTKLFKKVVGKTPKEFAREI